MVKHTVIQGYYNTPCEETNTHAHLYNELAT